MNINRVIINAAIVLCAFLVCAQSGASFEMAFRRNTVKSASRHTAVRRPSRLAYYMFLPSKDC